LRKKGFEPLQEGVGGISIKAELRSLSYDATAGIWTVGNIGNSAIKITVSAQSGEVYEKTYRGQKEIRTAFIASQETNAKVVNEALAETLENIFSDKELFDFILKNK